MICGIESIRYQTAHEMYPKVKVRVQDQEDNRSPENDSGTWVFLKFIESLYFEDNLAEEENTSGKFPLSIARSREAYPQHMKTRSTPTSKGMVKSSKQFGVGTKGNVRASSVPRPRAVLSSPENDGIFASINDSNNNKSSPQRKNGAEEKVGAGAKVKPEAINRKTPIKTPPSPRPRRALRACH